MIACPACGHSNPHGANFCTQCGVRVASPDPGAAPPEAERRQVTVLFCDMVGSTELSARLDPEDLRAIISGFHAACARAIAQADGFVAKYLGDGLLAYFGYPRAEEDDAERAVRAALAAVEATGRLRSADGEPLAARAGIATGVVVVGDAVGEGASLERGMVGETPNLAARLQALAAPGTVVIAPSTRRMLGRLFEYRELGPQNLKGFSRPVSAYQVIRPVTGESRFEARQEHGMAPLIGRAEELALLERSWREAVAGEGRAVILRGEPGIGKSRLVRALLDRTGGEAAVRLHYSCSPQHRDSALFPIVAQLEHDAGFVREDGPQARRAKLQALYAGLGMPPDDVSLIEDLLSIPPENSARPAFSARRQKERTFEALIRTVLAACRRKPVLMVFEDAHWGDPTTLELLGQFIGRLKQKPILLAITARPDFKPPWSAADVTALELARLGRSSAAALVAQISGRAALPAEVMRQIVERTDGVPLFVEELTKAVLESGAASGPRPRALIVRAIPTTLHDSLMARIDRLPSARLAVQTGSAIGREFSYELLRAAAGIDDRKLTEALGDLVRSELLFCHGEPPSAVYRFKHALVQDAAYESLLKSRRVGLHARIAGILERSPSLVETEPETLARHFTAARQPEQAIKYWLAAGRRASRRGAYLEAVSHFNAGIDIVASVADERERARLEIELQAPLGFALTALKGYTAPEVREAFSRAYELSPIAGETSHEIPVLFLRAISRDHWVGGNIPTATSSAFELLQIGERTQDGELTAIAHGLLLGILHHAGDLAASDAQFGKLDALYDPPRRGKILARFGEDNLSTVWPYHAFNLAWLGRIEEAWAAAEDIVASARQAAEAFSAATTICRTAVCAALLRDPAKTAPLAEEAQVSARALGLSPLLGQCAILIGWSTALDGRPEEGVSRIREGIALWHSTGAMAALPLYFALLADALLADGRPPEALAAADEGLEWSERNAERGWDCLLRCFRGDALAASGRPVEAEADFESALAWSRVRGARLGELYAAIRLGRLWRGAHRADEARALLKAVCGAFAEPAGTPLVGEARAVLAQLEAGPALDLAS